MSGGGGSPDPFPGTDVLGQLGAGAVTGGSGHAADPCSELKFTARLRSVDPGEAALVDVGTILVLDLFNTPRPQIGAFRIVHAEPQQLAATPVGVLLDRIPEIVPCLNSHIYVADVTRIDGGDVTVYIHSAGGQA